MRKLSVVVVTSLVVLVTVMVPAVASTILEVVVTDVPSAWRAEGQRAYEAAAAEFEKAYPDTDVNLQFRGWGQAYLDFLITSAAAGLQPDVFQIGGNHQGALGKAGLLLPLDGFISRWGYFDDFPPGVQDDVRVDGHICGVPYRADVRLLQYNRKDLDEAGLDRTKPPENWEGIISMGKKLTRRDAGGNIVSSGFRWYGSEFYVPVWQAGGDFIVERPGRPVVAVDSDEARRGLEFIRTLVTEYQVTPNTSRSVEGKKWGMEYGTASMEIRPEGHIRRLRDDQGIDLGVGPAIRQKEAAELVFINKWAIGHSTKNAMSAWQWIEFVSRREVASALQYATAGLPPRRSVAQLQPWVGDENYRAVFAAMAHVRPLPGAKYSGAAEIRKALIAMLKDVSGGTTPVGTAIENAKQAISIYLEKE